MSEKRFVLKELNFEDVVIEDTNTMSQYSIYGCEDLLNSLCDENEDLRKILKDTVSTIDEWYGNNYPNAIFKVTITLNPRIYDKIRRAIDER